MKNFKVLSASIMFIVLIVTATGASARWNVNIDTSGIAQEGPTVTTQDTVTLGHMMTGGYDAPTWGAHNELESFSYAAFWFESARLPRCDWHRNLGVIYLSEAIVLLLDSENAVAVALDVALMELAASSGNPNAFYWLKRCLWVYT